jgi:hypothetical protein
MCACACADGIPIVASVEEIEMIKQLCDIRNAITRLRVQLRFGTLSRAPLRLLRVEWRGDHVDCDWIARMHDQWDGDLSTRLSERNAALQALEDAITVRDLLFYSLQGISSATFRVYRQVDDETAELIIKGTVTRPEAVRWNVRSLAMQAKLCGLHFRLDDGKLVPLQVEE